MRWMEIAWTQDGIRETAGKAATPEIVAYFRDVGHPEITSDEVAWCAAFVGACLQRAGLPHTGSLMARSYLKYGTPIDTPRIGAIAVFRRTGDPSSGHVNFVTGWNDTHIKGYGGNQSNAVNERWFARSELLGLRWPEAATTAALAEQGSRIVTGAGQQQKDAVKGTSSLGLEWLIPSPDSLGIDVLAAKASAMQGSYQTLQAFGVFCWQHKGAVLTALAIYWLARTAWSAGWIKAWRTEDANTGKTIAPATAETTT